MRTTLTLLILALTALPCFGQSYRIKGSLDFDFTVEDIPVFPTPVAAWNFSDGTSSVGDYDLTNNNGVTFVDGKLGKAASFDGVDQSLSLTDANTGALSVGGDVTLSSWINFASLPSNATWHLAGIPGEYSLSIVDGFLGEPTLTATATDTTPTAVTATWSTVPTVDQWYHVVMRVDQDADELTLWVDGSKVANSAFTGTLRQTVVGFSFGGASTQFANTLIDESAVWDQALTDSEISYLYNSGTGRQFPLYYHNARYLPMIMRKHRFELAFAGPEIPAVATDFRIIHGASELPAVVRGASEQYRVVTGTTEQFATVRGGH